MQKLQQGTTDLARVRSSVWRACDENDLRRMNRIGSATFSIGPHSMPPAAHRQLARISVAFDALEVLREAPLSPISRRRRQPKCMPSPGLVHSRRPLRSSSSRKPAGPLSSRPSTRLDPRSAWGSATSATRKLAPLAAAVARGVNVEVIADHDDYYNKPDEQAELTTLIREKASRFT